jgi:hypothetical protein
MRFATIKTTEQQAVLTLYRSRELLVKQETMLANLIRGCLGEFESLQTPRRREMDSNFRFRAR